MDIALYENFGLSADRNDQLKQCCDDLKVDLVSAINNSDDALTFLV